MEVAGALDQHLKADWEELKMKETSEDKLETVR